jgi:hypothetical protein
MEDFLYFAYAGSARRMQAVENTRKNKYFAASELSPVNSAKPKGFRGQTRASSDKKSVKWVTDRRQIFWSN